MKRIYPLILLAVALLLVSACKKNVDNTGTGEFAPPIFAPLITTTDISSIVSDGALSGGNISDSSGDPITARGVCYGPSHNPTIDGSIADLIVNGATFVSKITGLNEHVTYYARAYATNSAGTSYGNEVNFMTTVALGQSYLGGIVFYLDARGEHGLVAAPVDAADASWGCPGDSINGANLTGIWEGDLNTNQIVSECTEANIAAKICRAKGSEWYLPSISELTELFKQRRLFGNLSSDVYWSSTQADKDFAYQFSFTSPGSAISAPKGASAKVRPIRAF